MSNPSAISMDNISFGYGARRLIDQFYLNIPAGKIYCLVGGSGSGKTTVLRLMNGLLKPQNGEVKIHDNAVDFTQAEKLRRGMGYSIQGSGLFPHLTLQENLSIIARKEKWDKQKIKARVHELCDLLDLPKSDTFLKLKPRQISGGQQQRIGIARALFMKPDIMLMDEPFSALDPITRTELQKQFLQLQHQLNLTIVLVTHDLPEAFKMADKIILLNHGKIEQMAKPSAFLLNPQTPYVSEFLKSNSPGNLLKEIYLYSVMNTNVFVSTQSSDQIKVTSLESGDNTYFDDRDAMIDFLRSHHQSHIYWVNDNNQFINYQEIGSPMGQLHGDALSSTEHILHAMKTILHKKFSTLPVVNKNNQVVGVFSESALNAL